MGILIGIFICLLFFFHSSCRGAGGKPSRGGRGGARGGRKAPAKTPTKEELDAELDAYAAKMETE